MTICLRTAKRAFKLTDAELLTLPHEQIAASPKSYYALRDIQRFAHRKFQAGALLEDFSEGPDVVGFLEGKRQEYRDNE